jgi:beta-glucosidase
MESWLDGIPAILEAWYPGEAGGTAVAEALFGDFSPGGKLPITFPRSAGQLPLAYNHEPTGRGDDYADMTGRPLFPFGHGLSYASFVYEGLRFEPSRIPLDGKAVVSCRVRNAGGMPADEVVQLYLQAAGGNVVRPVMELKGFQRIRLRPGESREVAFELGPEQLSRLDAALRTVVEPGEFRIMVGSSSRDIRLRGVLTVGR